MARSCGFFVLNKVMIKRKTLFPIYDGQQIGNN